MKTLSITGSLFKRISRTLYRVEIPERGAIVDKEEQVSLFYYVPALLPVRKIAY